MYRIGINGAFLRKPYTGTGQVTYHTLRELASRKTYHIGGKEVDAKEVVFYVYVDEVNEYIDRSLFEKEGEGTGIVLRECSFWYKRDDLVRKWLFERFVLLKKAKEDDLDAFVSLYQSATVFSLFSPIHHTMLVHDIIPEVCPEYRETSRKKHYWNFVKRGIRRASHIVTVSKYSEKDIVKHLHRDPKTITIAPIDVDPIFSQMASRERASTVLRHYAIDRTYFFLTGGLEKRKNAKNVLLAYKKLRDTSDDSQELPLLVISGALLPHLAPLITDVEKLVKQYNLTQYVRILGSVPMHDLPVLYQEALCVIFVSYYEGFGMPVLEGMRSGTPIITTKKTSLPEVGGDAVLYCDGSIEGIEKALKEILENELLRKELVRRGCERAKLFSWDRFITKLFSHIPYKVK